MASLRNIVRFLAPRWLTEGDGGKVMFSLSILVDASVQRLRSGLEARLPSRAGPSALQLIGADRGLIRGRSEVQSHFAARLLAWRYPRGHRVRGSAFALLEQIAEYWGAAMLASTIDARGTTHARSALGVETFAYGGGPYSWDLLPTTPYWGRFWVRMTPAVGSGIGTTPNFGDPALWGGALGTLGYTIGQVGVTPDDVVSMRRLLRGRAWKPAGVRAEWAVVTVGAVTTSPDGTWGRWSKNVAGTQVASRDSGLRFWSFSPETNNSPGGDVTNYPTLATLPDGSTYAGILNYPLSTTLPDGTVYAGNPASFPATVQLVDDGAPPT